MQGYLSLVLHAHLPFVRHPEHERFLEENWLFEAITDTYVPLLRTIEGWSNDRMQAPISLTLSPTLCTMLMDPLLQSRYRRHLDDLLDLAKKRDPAHPMGKANSRVGLLLPRTVRIRP